MRHEVHPALLQAPSQPGQPEDLRVTCMNRHCHFSRGLSLPILAVDEPIYRRLPCFMIATVDKFAAMPWTGEVGAFFGRVERYDETRVLWTLRAAGGHACPMAGCSLRT